MSYSLEEKLRARELYVESGLTFEQVSGETGISLSHIKRWAKEGSWSKEKEEFESETLELHAQVQKLKVKLTREALATVDPQKIYALASLMRASSIKKNHQGGEDKAALFLEFMGDLVDYLREKDPESLRYLQPHIRSFAEGMKTA